jgi:hypothetical protein
MPTAVLKARLPNIAACINRIEQGNEMALQLVASMSFYSLQWPLCDTSLMGAQKRDIRFTRPRLRVQEPEDAEVLHGFGNQGGPETTPPAKLTAATNIARPRTTEKTQAAVAASCLVEGHQFRAPRMKIESI